MLDDLELSLMAFPQSWTAATNTLTINLLVLPVGNPLGPVGSVAAFAGTTLELTAKLFAGEAFPATASVPAASTPFVAVPPAGAAALLTRIVGLLPAGTTVTTGKVTAANAPPPHVRVMKSLPPSYTQAIPFSRPSNPALFVTGDGYGCAVEAQAPIIAPPFAAPPPLPKTISWGQIVSYILRQPKLAQACGFVYTTSLVLPAAAVTDTSWIGFAIDTGVPTNPFASDVAANPDTVRTYVARLPALGGDRGLFAAVLFPVVATPPASLALPDQEAQTYDDGFAQVVHAFQPPTVDAATGGTDGIAPGAEAGIQLAWDDEQVTIWLDRQVGLLRARATNTPSPDFPEAPLGVLGYRVDVRPTGTTAWESLCAVTGSLPFSGAASTGTGTTTIGAADELFITPSPVRALPSGSGPGAEPSWLPLYFTAWRGVSLVTRDPTVGAINPPTPAGTPALPTSALTGVPVAPPVYGNSYDFRIRFTDLTGGGPDVAGAPVHAGLAPIATVPFRRYIPPKSLEVTASPPLPAPPPPSPTGSVNLLTPPAVRAITQLAVRRPRLGYPEAIFTGVSPAVFAGASLAALLADAAASGRALGVPDPDVDRFLVTVEAAIPDHDTGPAGTDPGDIDGTKWRIVYSIVERFPAGADPTLTLNLSYVDIPDIAAMVPPVDDAPTLLVPTARDVRIRLTPLCAVKSNYYGTPEPPPGLVTDYIVRQEAATESSLFPFVPAQQLLACYLQPGGDLPALVGQAFGLGANGLTLSGPPGVRTVIANSAALRCTLAPDRSALTVSNANELLGHWIVALTIDIARDWTWDGFASPALTVTRDGTPIGTFVFPGAVAPSIVLDAANPPDRTKTRLVFLDAIVAQPVGGAFPTVLEPQYAVTVAFPTAAAIQQTWTTLRLPITTAPAQTPKIVSTGIAESPYVAAADYSSTSLRDRYLWIEFDAPIADAGDDVYFGRVLAYGPDPLLAGDLLPPHGVPVSAEPSLAIDPEPVRVVFAGQDSDESGLAAMVPLTPASPGGSVPDGVHFLLPLPAGLTEDALELFGFWTYEFRVGHAKMWSTAQGRFGRPLRLAGVQHPPPRLTCTVWRTTSGITVTAPYATTLVDGVPAFDPRYGDPQTVVWFMLYVQVLQTDGASWRNVLIDRTVGHVLYARQQPQIAETLAANREPRATATFSEDVIRGLLEMLDLPANSPLSVLAVEVLPGPIAPRTDAPRTVAAAPAQLTSVGPATAVAVAAPVEDPLGTELGNRRILRTSPLAAVPSIC